MIKHFQQRIYGYECDIYGHLNNANYLHILESARSEAMQDIKMPIDKLMKLGWHVYVRRVEMDFIKAAVLDDIVEVRSTILELNRVRSHWLQEIYDSSGDLCFQVHIHVVHVRDGKPARVPDDIYSCFSLLA